MRKSVEVRKKGESDIGLNNPDLLSCSSHFYADSCSRHAGAHNQQVIKNRIDWDIKKISYLNKRYAKILPYLDGKVMKTLVPFIFLRIAVLF